MKEGGLRWARGATGEQHDAFPILVRKPERMRPLGRPKRPWDGICKRT